MRHVKFDPAITRWARFRPGPFSGRDPETVIDKAYRSFQAHGDVGRIHSPLAFMVALSEFNCGAVETVFGGFVLGYDERKQRIKEGGDRT